MDDPAGHDPGATSAVAAALLVVAAVWLVAGLLVLGSDATGALTLAVAPAALLAAVGAFLAR
jgi:hypothetical protein